MSKSNNRIPFKSSNNKNSPYNMNEIDINLLMSNPKHIHKMMGKETGEVDENEDNTLPLIDVPKHLRNATKSGSDNLKFFKETGSGLLKKYMDKDKKRHRTVAERLDKTQSNMYKNVDKTKKATGHAIKNFKKDVNEKGFVNTIGNRQDRAMDMIIKYMDDENGLFRKFNNKLEPMDKYMKKIDPDFGETQKKYREERSQKKNEGQ